MVKIANPRDGSRPFAIKALYKIFLSKMEKRTDKTLKIARRPCYRNCDKTKPRNVVFEIPY